MDVAEHSKSHALEDTCWWWVGRRDLIRALLAHLAPSKALILDVGTGTGGNLGVLSEYGTVVGVDSAPEALAYAASRGESHLVQGDVGQLCFKRNTFDVVTALDVLEHVDDAAALSCIYSVLKADGKLVLTVPAFQALWSGHDVALGHRRRYRKKELLHVLDSCNFRVIKASYWNTSLFLPIAMARVSTRMLRGLRPQTDVRGFSGPVDSTLARILKVEAFLLRHIDLPFGLSLVCLASPRK